MKLPTLREKDLPPGVIDVEWLTDGSRILIMEGRKYYKCKKCGWEIRRNSRNNQLKFCPKCGNNLEPLDFMVVVQQQDGTLVYPTYKDLAEYLLSLDEKEKDKVFNIVKLIYEKDEMLWVEEHEWFLKYIYFLFQEEEVNYPQPKYRGKEYTFSFFKDLMDNKSLEETMKKYKIVK